MLLFLFIIAIIAGIIFPKSKVITIYQIAICAIMFAFNVDIPDYKGYYGTYYSIIEGGIYESHFERFGFLYKAICKLSISIGLDFNTFRLFLFLGCIFLIIFSVKKLTPRINLVLSLYMVFPFTMDCIQIRNFIAEAVIIFAFQFIFLSTEQKNANKKNIILFITFVIIATLFHPTSLIYLIYLPMFFQNSVKKLLKIEAASMWGCCILILVGSITIFKNSGYLKTRTSMITFVTFSASIIVIDLLINHFIKNHNVGKHISIEKYTKEINFLKNTMVFIPLLMFNGEMFRLIRNTLIIISAFVADYIDNIQKDYRGKKIILCSSVGIIICFFVVYYLLLYRSAFYAYDVPLLNVIIDSINFRR